MKLKITIAFLFINVFVFAQQKTYVISSGERGGNYYNTGIVLDSILTNYYGKDFYFKNVWSKGSIDNLKNLENRKADFALVQHNVLLQNFYNASSGAKDIEVIAPLFQEELQIYCKWNKPVVSVEKLKKDLKAWQKSSGKLKLGVVSKESSSYKIFEEIAQLLNIDFSEAEIVEANYDVLIEQLKKNEIQYLITFSAELEDLKGLSNKANVCFSEKEVRFILSRTKNLFKQSTVNKKYFKLGTYTYLIGLSRKVEELDEIKPIFNVLQEQTRYAVFHKNINKSVEDFKDKTKELVGFLPLNSHFASEISHIDKYKYVREIGGSFILCCLLGLLYFKRKQVVGFIKLKRNWYRYNHIIIGVLLLVILYWITVELMIYGENQLNDTVNIKSQLINMPRRQLHFWLIISNLSQNSYGISPVSTLGKLMYSLSFYSLWIGGICITIIELLKKKVIRKRNDGMMKITDENHTIITGWNKNTELFIKGFFSAQEYVKNKTKLVLVIKNAGKLREECRYIEELVSERRLSLVNGDIREVSTLEMANVAKAKTVVLFAEDNTSRADEKTLLRALSISRHCRKLAVENCKGAQMQANHFIDAIYIIAEVNDNLYKEDLYKADVNEIICSAVYNKNIITQSIFNHGVSKVFDEVLNYNEFNEFYEIDLKKAENAKFRRKTFDELLVLLRKADILLIAIHKLYYNEQTDELIIDKEEIKKLLEKDGLERELIINPKSEAERNHEADDDDSLIVLCYDEKTLLQNLANLEA